MAAFDSIPMPNCLCGADYLRRDVEVLGACKQAPFNFKKPLCQDGAVQVCTAVLLSYVKSLLLSYGRHEDSHKFMTSNCATVTGYRAGHGLTLDALPDRNASSQNPNTDNGVHQAGGPSSLRSSFQTLRPTLQPHRESSKSKLYF